MKPNKTETIKLPKAGPRITDPHETAENFMAVMSEIKSADDRNVRDFEEIISSFKSPEKFNPSLTNDQEKENTLITPKSKKELICNFENIPSTEPIIEKVITPRDQKAGGITFAKDDINSERSTIQKEKKSDDKKLYGFLTIQKYRKFSINFTESIFFNIFEILLLIANIVAYCIHDYSDRLNHDPDQARFLISYYLELICNIFYVLIFFLNLIAYGGFSKPNAYFRSRFNIFNFCIIVSSFLIYIPSEKGSAVFKVIRLMRPLLLVHLIPSIRKTFIAFCKTLYSIREILFQISFLLLFFSIFGLHMLQGLLESRCRFTQTPVDGLWPVNPNITQLCGTNPCPEGFFCENPSLIDFPYNHTEVDIEDLNYGLSNFDTIFNSLLNGLNFFTFTGWSKLNDIYWNAYSKIVVALYTISFVFILGLIMMNLLMASLYEAFVSHTRNQRQNTYKKKTIEVKEELEQMAALNLEKTNAINLNDNDPILKKKSSGKNRTHKLSTFRKSIMNNNKEKENEGLIQGNDITLVEKSPSIGFQVEVYYKGFTFEKEPLQNASKFRTFIYNFITSNFFQYVILLILLLNIVVLASDHSDISDQSLSQIMKIDFAITWIFAFEILLRLIIFMPKKFFTNYFDIMDLIIIVFNVGLIIWNYINEVDQFVSVYSSGAAINCLKFLRIFRFLVGMVIWKRGAILFMEMIYALYKTKEFLAFSSIVMLIFSLIGRELFAFRVIVQNEETGTLDLTSNNSPRINFDEIGDAFVATSLVFLNEEWQTIMFDYQRGLTHAAALFFAIMLLLGTVAMMKMFVMLFINSLLHSQNIKNLYKIQNFFSECLDFIKEKIKSLNGKNKANEKNKPLEPIEHSKIFDNLQIKNEIQMIPKKGKQIPNDTNGIAYNPVKGQKESTKEEKEIFSSLKIPSGQIGQIKIPLEGLAKTPNTAMINMSESYNPIVKSQSISPVRGSLKKKEYLMQLTKFNKKIVDLEGKSLYLFEKTNKFRLFLHKIITNSKFEKAIIIIIILSIVILIISNPMNDPNTVSSNLLYMGDCIVVSLYFIEILMKIISHGFLLNGPHSFTMDLWNCIDLLIFILTLLGTIDTRFEFSQYDFKWCRALRIFKLIQYNTGLKEAMHNLFLSIPDIISLWMFYLMNLLFFGMIATKYLKSTLNYCDSLDSEFVNMVFTKYDCFDYGGDWLRRDLNFDDISNSLSTLFQIATTEGWMELMFEAWDHVGPNMSPIINYHKTMAIFYLTFFFIANVILMTTIIGILVETYLYQKEKNDPASKYSENQKEWAKIKEFIYKMNPKVVRPPPKNKLSLRIREIAKSKLFIQFILFVTLLNTILFMLYWHRQPAAMKTSLDYINAVFVGIFSIEITMNFISQGPCVFFKKMWNIFDVFIIICSWIGFAFLVDPKYAGESWVHALANCIQVLRIIRVIKKVKFLKKLFSVFKNILPQIKNIFLLMFLFFVTYGIIGVNFFAFLKPQETVGGDDINFRNFFVALVDLARITTAEEWYKILSDCARKMQPNFVCFEITHFSDYQKYGLEGCGNSIANLYFFSFLIVNTLLILNLFVAMILNAAEEHKRSSTQTNEYRIDEAISLWKTFDPKGLGYMNYKTFYRYYKIIAIKLGVDIQDFMDPQNRMMFLRFCAIPIYEHTGEKIYCVRFHDCVMKIGQMAVFLNHGKKDLEPEEGFHHLIKYEIKLIQNKEFELSPFKADDIEKLRKIYKALHFFLNKKSKPVRSFAEIVNMVIKNKGKIGPDAVEFKRNSKTSQIIEPKKRGSF